MDNENEILIKIGISQDESIGVLKTKIDVLTDSINKTRQTLRGLDVTWKEFMDKRMAEGEHNHAVIAKEWAEYKKIQLAKIDLNTEVNKKLTAQLGSELSQRQQLSNQLSQSLKSTTDKVAANTFEEGSIMQLRQALSKATAEYNRMGEVKRNSVKGKELETSIINQTQAISALEQKMGNFRRNVGNYASGWNGLSNSINQVTRELPNFAQSATIGFMALSNNLPIMLEEFNKVIAANKVLQAEGKATSSVLSQVGKALFGWHSLVITAISLSVLYGEEIKDFFTGTTAASKEAEKANKEYAKSLKEIGKAASDTAIKDKFMMQIWVDTAQNAEAAMTNRIEAVKKLQETYPETFGLLSQNIILEGDLATAIKHTTDMLYAKARADAAVNSGVEAEKRLRDLKEIKKNIEDEFRKSTDTKLGTTSAELLTAALFIDEDVYDRLIDINQRILSASKDSVRFRKEAEAAFEIDMPSGLGKNGSSKEKKAKEKRDKELLDMEREYQRLLIENKYQGFAEELKLRELENKFELEDLKKKGASQKLIEAKEAEHQIKIHEIKQKWIGLNAEAASKARDEEYKANTKIQEDLSKERQKALAEAMKGVDEYEKWKEKQANAEEKNRKLAKEAAINAAKQTVDAIAQIKQQELDRQLKRELTAIQRQADGQDAILKHRLENGLITEATYLGEKQKLNEETAAKELEINKKAFENKKRLDTAILTTNYALELSAIAANAAANPSNAFTFGSAGLAQYAALFGPATAKYFGNLAVIQSAKFALGGKVQGKSHAQGGVMIEAEGGEGMINKNSMRSNQVMQVIGTPSQIASAINTTGGGVSWEQGATLRPNPNMFSNNSSSQSITYSQMAALITDLKQGINDKKVILLESDVTKTQNKVKTYESASKF